MILDYIIIAAAVLLFVAGVAIVAACIGHSTDDGE